MASFPLHPRLSRLCVAGEELGAVDDACGAAALLSEKDIRESRGPFGHQVNDEPTQDSDVGLLLDKLREAEASGFSAHALRAIGLDARAVQTVNAARRDLTRRCRAKKEAPSSPAAADEALARALLLAFPDRFAKRQKKGSPRLAIASGISGTLSERSVVRDAPFMLAVDADDSRGVVVRLASAVDPSYVLDAFVGDVVEERDLTWNAERGRVEATTRLLYDGIAFDETVEARPSGPDVSTTLARAALEAGLGRFGPEGELDALLARARYAEAHGLSVKVPDDDALLRIVEAACEGKRSFRELEDVGLVGWIHAAIEGGERLPSLCPATIGLPSGRKVTVHYEVGKPPWLESYLQDFFGLSESPKVLGEPVVIHLLAPNKRAVQITRDLPSFFRTHYPPLRKELGRRYPKHAWPEDTSVPVPMRVPRPRPR
jgi:ATP-dependent helicase HrpB